MHILFVYCHPSEASFCAAIRDSAVAAARDAGHEVTLVDLYGEHFDPVMHATEWRGYEDAGQLPPDLVRHLGAMVRADAIIFIYPTWWDAPPALLKGWIDRLWRPSYAFHNDDTATSLLPGMSNVRLMGVISTFGGPGNQPGFGMLTRTQRIFLDTLKPCINRRAKRFGLAMFEVGSASDTDRQDFLHRVRQTIAKLA